LYFYLILDYPLRKLFYIHQRLSKVLLSRLVNIYIFFMVLSDKDGNEPEKRKQNEWMSHINCSVTSSLRAEHGNVFFPTPEYTRWISFGIYTAHLDVPAKKCESWWSFSSINISSFEKCLHKKRERKTGYRCDVGEVYLMPVLWLLQKDIYREWSFWN